LASANDAAVFVESTHLLLATHIDLPGHLIGRELAVDILSQAAVALQARVGDAHSPRDPMAVPASRVRPRTAIIKPITYR
jgi:hypothetical protein